MNKLIIVSSKLLIALPIFLMTACGGDSNSEEPVDPLSYSIKIESQEEIELDNAQIRIRLFGTHRHVADNEATLISDSVQSIDKVPTTIDLQWPENDYQLIDSPPVSVQEDAEYYLTIRIDSDGDSVICSGDFVQDYDKTPFTRINGIPSEPIEFYITTATNESCYIF